MRVSVPLGSATKRIDVPWYAGAAFVAIAVVAAISLANPAQAHSAAPVGILLGNLVAGIMFIRGSAKLERGERRAWTLVGIGLIIAACGIVAVSLLVAITGDAPTFGATDLFFIFGYSIALVGFASLPHTAGTALQRARTAFDGMIGAIAIGALLWTLVLLPVVEGLAEAETWERFIGSIYPLIDLAVVVIIMMITVRRSSYRFDARMVTFTGAMLLQAVADVSFLVEGVGQSFTEAEPLWIGFLAAATLFLVTALIVDRVPEAREYADRRLPLWSLLAPYTSAAVMVSIMVVRLWDSNLDQGDWILLLAALVVATLVIGRQGIAIRENRLLVERQRSDLVSSISHELRTPLTAMVGFLAVLQEDQALTREERDEMIDVVSEQANYLTRIVQDLLLLAHDDPSRIELAVSEYRIESIINSSLSASGVDRSCVAIEVDPNLTAIVDGGRLQQLLVNLLTNARRYGGDRCLVAAVAESGRLEIEVHDSGPGVPKKHELTIWERFERGPNRYNAAVPGSGIGLAMVRAIVEAHGGRATYRPSERLGGACFAVELPGRVGVQNPKPPVRSGTMAIG